jgi:uncharacterized protein YxeA
MKKITSIIMAMLMLVGGSALFTSCSSSTSSDSSSSTVEEEQTTEAETVEQADEEQTTEAETVEQADEEDGKLGDYVVDIKSSRLSKNMSGDKVVIITYGFTNNSDSAESFTSAFNAQAYQDGVEIERDYFVQDDSYDSNSSTKDIKSGKTVDVEVAYTLNDTKTDVDVEVTELISLSDDMVTKTFKLK